MKGDSYGYDIGKKISEAGEGLIELKDATIYTAFRRMEDDGLIRAYWSEGEVGARRRYYTITDSGKIYYARKKDEWRKLSAILDRLINGG